MYQGAVEFSQSIYSNPSIEVSDWRFSHDNSNMPLQRRRHQVALYRSVIKVLTFFSLILTSSFCSLFSFFHPSFLSLSRSPIFHTVLSFSLIHSPTYFSPPPSSVFSLIICSLCPPLSQTGLAYSFVWTQRRPVGWSPAQRWNSTTAAHIKRESSCHRRRPPLSPLPTPQPLICSIDGRAQLNLGQWCTDAHNST